VGSIPTFGTEAEKSLDSLIFRFFYGRNLLIKRPLIQQLKNKIRAEAKKEERKKLTVLLIAVISTLIIFGVLYWLMGDLFIEFWQ
jgi:hypothetical protein